MSEPERVLLIVANGTCETSARGAAPIGQDAGSNASKVQNQPDSPTAASRRDAPGASARTDFESPPACGEKKRSIENLIKLNRTLPPTTITELSLIEPQQDLSTHTHRHNAHWAELARCIEAHYYQFDGFVVWAAPETIPYTASALSFMLENLGKTVIFTGSRLPFTNAFSDGIRNLFTAISLAGTIDIPEVLVFENTHLLRANRCRFGHSARARKPWAQDGEVGCMGAGSGAWGADASISSPNMRPLVVVDAHTGAVHVDRLAVLAPPKGRLRVHLSMEARMVVIKMVPNVDLAPLVRLASVGTDTCRAIILELYGTGNAPKLAPRLVEALEIARNKEVVVVACSQCARGTVNLHAYATADALLRLGVVPALDMTTETACSKLGYLLGKGLGFGQIQRAMIENLRGEITPAAGGLAYQLRARI